jgi:integrase
MKPPQHQLDAEDSAPRKVQSAGKNEFRLFTKDNSPYLHVRVMVEGKRRQFSTGEKSERAAKTKAKAILVDIRSRGFKEAIQLHARKKEEKIGSDPTLADLGDFYEKNLRFFDKSPAAETARYYAAMLARIGTLAGVSRLSGLTPDAIQKAKAKYLKQAEKEGRNRDSAVTSLATMIRNAAAVFSRQSLEIFRQQGLEIANPFSGTKVRGVKVKSYSPMSRELVAAIWKKASLLRDGNPDSGPPDRTDRSGTDFREPQPAVFALLILELGLGLRRNEADKARWDWIFQAADGRRYLEVRETADFRPKSRQSRIIPVADEVWEAIADLKKEDSIFVVPGPLAAKPTKKAQRTYRCGTSHDALVFWLKKAGVSDPKPCHALRKEFGSYVATCFSLFHAQKLLGHSTPAVTSAYYASLTDLPHLTPSRMGSPQP